MNTITLAGRVPAHPVYHCSVRGMDLTRLQIETRDRRGDLHRHHCLAYGPAALALHEHLEEGNHLLVRGELLYRAYRIGQRTVNRPYVLIRGYSFLDGAVRKSVRPRKTAAASGSG